VFSSTSDSTWVMIILSVFAYALTSRPTVKVIFHSLRPWRPWGKVECQRVVSTALGASKCFPSPFGMWTGRGILGRSRPPASMDQRIPSSTCGSTLSTFEQLEATDASWQTGSRWLERTSLSGGSGDCRRDLSRPRGISANACSTSTLPWGWSQRARRHALPSVASPQGARRQSWGRGGSAFLPSAEKKGFSYP
jgi:hypothetical protein